MPFIKHENESPLIWLPRLLLVLALLAFVGYFIVYAIYAFALFQFPFDYDQGEGFELMDTVLFSQGEWPYRSNDEYPFYSSNYPPLFHVVIVPLVWLFGPQYWTGRLVSYLGTLITAAAIGYGVQRYSRRWWLSVLCGLAFLASNYVYQVGPLFRQHMFMVMFETLAVVLLALTVDREEKKGSRLNGTFGRFSTGRFFLVMVLLLAAGYTKQLAYATVAAVFIFLFLRQPKRAVLWAVPFAAVTGLIYLWIDWATNGLWTLNTITANVNPLVAGQAEGLYRQWFRLHMIITVVAALYAFYQLYQERLSLFTIWFGLAVVNAATSGTWGAGASYFATAIAASCILTGLALGRLLDWLERHQNDVHLPLAFYGRTWQLPKPPGPLLPIGAYSLVAVLFLIQANQMFHMPTHTPTLERIAALLGKETAVYISPQTSCSQRQPPQRIPYVDSAGVSLLGRPPNAADTEAGRQIAALIAEGETAAFAEDAGFNFYLGRDIVTNPTQLRNLYHYGAVDLTEMLDMLDRQAFDTVVFRAQFYPPPVLDMIGQRYETEHLVQMNGFVYCIMRPK